MTYLLQSFESALNETIQALAARVQTYLNSVPTYVVVDVSASRRSTTRTSDRAVIRLLLAPGTGAALDLQVTALQSSPAQSLDAAAQAYWAANPGRTIIKQADLTASTQREDALAILLITAASQQIPGNVFFAEPIIGIFAQDFESALIFDADGNPLGTQSVYNVSSSHWPAGQRAPVVYQAGRLAGATPT